ncbi:MAG: zinc ABC transporter substrate-binding protein [Longimonas sp.]|uniref:metal ABC transporter solute-binding protein, Zn/Mn family n=1 Tax=Longimonas sp. TaxID=2039626 RepID=UPI003976D380
MLVAGCSSSGADSTSEDRVSVVATTNVVGDLVRQVGGDAVALTTLMGPGIDPHQYNASEGDVQRMAGADMVVYNGLHLEGKMVDLFPEMDRRGISTTALAEASVPDSLRIGSTEYASAYDPHVWFDVSLWRRAALHLGDALADLDPDHATAYRERAADYAARLDSLDTYAREQIATIPETQRVLVTSHDAFRYLGAAYDIEVRGLQGISTDSEAGTADVQALAGFIAERQIPTIFAETSVSERGLQAVQEAVRSRGFEVQLGNALYGDALGDAGTPTGTYIGAVRHNIDTIVEGLTDSDSAAPTTARR